LKSLVPIIQWHLGRQPCLDPQVYACPTQQAYVLGFDVISPVHAGEQP
jgi:hypothetical protein